MGKPYNYHGVSPQSANITGFIHNIHRVSLWFLQPFSIDSSGFPCRDPVIPSPHSFHGVKICSVVEWWKELFLFSGNWKLARIELSGHIRESFRRHPLWNQWVKKFDRFAFESEFDWVFAGFNWWPAQIDYFQNWPKSFSRPQP